MKCLLVSAFLVSAPLAFSAITVTTTDDSGPGSLREAISQVNASTNDFETINFNISGSGAHVIKPLTSLPAITNSVVINGYSQPGSRPNALVQGDDAIILIGIDDQLLVAGYGSEVYGLSVRAMQLQGYGDIVQGNFIGADPSGTNGIPNASGLYLRAAFAHQIGGPNPADRNLISGNNIGIGGFDAQNPFGPLKATRLQGNYIGTDRSGTRPLSGTGLGNPGAGISIAAPDQIIGGTGPGEGNIIAFNGEGVHVGGRASNQQILGNSIFSNPNGGITGGKTGPLITSAIPGSTTVKGTFTGTAGTTYRIEIFVSDDCDLGSLGQGKTFIGSANSVADASGRGEFSVPLSTPLSPGATLAATASPNTFADEGTSNFSHCTAVVQPLDLALSITAPTGPIPAAGQASFTVTIKNNSTETATGVIFSGTMPEPLKINSVPPGWTNDTEFVGDVLINTVSTVFPALAPGASASGTISFTPSVIGHFRSSFQISGVQPDEIQSNNIVQVDTAIFNPAPRQIMVTNTATSGPGSMDQAVTDVNEGVGGDTIAFNIPGSGLQKITNPYLTLQVPVTIDGFTQPGAKPNSLINGENAVLLVELAGSLYFEGGSSTARGLVLSSVYFQGKPGFAGGSNIVEGCFIGTDSSGLHASTNSGAGIQITGADDTRIGGPAPAQRNIISGVAGGAIGGGTPAAIISDSARTIIQGNYIGTDATGLNSIENKGNGITFASGSSGTGPVAGGLVGGTGPGEANIIAFNRGVGVSVVDPKSGISILGNSIFGNLGIGISLGQYRVSATQAPLSFGFDGIAAAPVITNATFSGSSTHVQGYLQALTNETYRLEFFVSPTNLNAYLQDEGKALLGFKSVTTDSKGRAEFDISLPASSGLVSATATDSNGISSTFFTFYQAPPTPCLRPGDLLTGITYGNLVGLDLKITHYVPAVSNIGQPVGVFYQRTAPGSSIETRSIRDLAVANDALWVVDTALGTVSRFSLCGGEPLGVFLEDTNSLPYCLTFDASGDVYVGFNRTNNNLKKFDPSGHMLDEYSLFCDRTIGILGMDLAADQHTLYYGSSGTKVHRYDVATHQQLTDFATNIFDANYFRILPDGGLVTADQRWVRRYDASGKGVWTNSLQGKYWWSSIRLDPDRKTFWGLDLGPTVVQFDIATGARIKEFATDVPVTSLSASALAVMGEPTAARGGAISPSRPSLRISSSGAQLQLTWNASDTGYSIQTSPTIGPANWQNLVIQPTAANGQFSVPIDNNKQERMRFYRLIKP